MRRTYLLGGLVAGAFAAAAFTLSLPSATAAPTSGLLPATVASAPALAGATIRVSPSHAPPGATIIISGHVPLRTAEACGAPNGIQFTSMSALFPPDGFGPTTTPSARGDFHVRYAIPTSTPPGKYSIGMRCGGGNLGVEASLSVTAGPSKPSIKASPSTASPGEKVTISGDVPEHGMLECPAADPVQLTSTAALFPPDGFGPQATRNAVGHFLVHYPIPTSTPAGTYQIGARCGGGNVGVSAELHVT